MNVETSLFAIRELLTGGDRRSIADSNRVRAMIERDRSLVDALVELANDDDWLVSQRALDLLEKLSQDHPEWIEPHKRIFIGPRAKSDKWEVRLQIVRALPLFRWTSAQERRVESILIENVGFPQTSCGRGPSTALRHSPPKYLGSGRRSSSIFAPSSAPRARRSRPARETSVHD